jgi:hypothetical protein
MSTATTVLTAKPTWKQGNNPRVSFANLDKLQRYEPETYRLFTQPVQDGERISTSTYDYVVKIQRWGPSVTRFLKDNVSDSSKQSYHEQEQEQEQQPQLSTQGSLSKLTASLPPNTKLILELEAMLAQVNVKLQQLKTQTQVQASK